MNTQTMTGPGVPARTGRTAKTVLFVAAAALAAVDLASKALAEALLSSGAVIDLGLINIRLLYNRGIAFSLGAELPAWVVVAATGLIIAVLVWYAAKTAPFMTGLSVAGAALLLGGAAGNFIDRLDGYGVVDYLHTGWFPTFNLADAFVTAGVAVYALGTMVRKRTQPHPTTKR